MIRRFAGWVFALVMLASLASHSPAQNGGVHKLSTPGTGTGTTKTPNTGGSNARGGVDRTRPTSDDFRVRDTLNEGEYYDAEKGFRSTGRSAVRDIYGRWIDSICHYTMMAETQYRVGRTAEALENYTEAIKLYIAY